MVYSSKRYFERINKGLCPRCPNLLIEGKKKCHSCSELVARTREKKRQSQGLCSSCGRPSLDFALCIECRLGSRISGKKRYQKMKNLDLCQCCSKPLIDKRLLCQECYEKKRKVQKTHCSKLRERAIKGYGGICKCCGEDTFEFLTLDHVNNDGAEHRREVKNSYKIYQWAIDNDFPPRLQVLCMNCNCAKQWFGACPHNIDYTFYDTFCIDALSHIRKSPKVSISP